jgi:hypothetical protein
MNGVPADGSASRLHHIHGRGHGSLWPKVGALEHLLSRPPFEIADIKYAGFKRIGYKHTP